MNVLIVGAGKGSWQMRGVQIGAALGARVLTDPTDADWQWADVAILLKKTAERWAPEAHRFHVPIIWDVLDCWSQPRDNRWSVDEGVQHIAALKHRIRPTAMIAATQTMADAIGGTYIPHHGRLGLTPTPPREQIQVVAYDGSERYLGRWEEAIRAACWRRGWTFVINPPDLSQVDLLVALRGDEWDGPICRAWKSGVKFVNAIRAGRPVLTQPCAAVDELQPVAALIERAIELDDALETLTIPSIRNAAAATTAADQFTVEAIAETYYRPLLARVCTEASCAA